MCEQDGLTQVSVRLPAETVTWLDALVALHRTTHPGRRFTRSDALREAVLYAQSSSEVCA